MDTKNYTKYWFLEDFNFLSKMGRMNLMKLCAELEMEYIQKGERIKFNEGELRRVIFLKKGTVKIVDSELEQVKYIVKNKNIFGELDEEFSQDKNRAPEHAIALEDCVLCYIEANQMEGLLEKFSSLKNSIIKIQNFRIKRLEARLSDLIYKDSETRIRDFIIAFIQDYGTPVDDKIEMKNMLNHTDIAHLTNTSRQTVNNVLTKLRKEGKLDYSRKFISYRK
jgi:CRP/FNR family transcriptional regulator